MKRLILVLAVGMLAVPSTSDARPAVKRARANGRKVKKSTALPGLSRSSKGRRGRWDNPEVSTKRQGESIRVTVKHRTGGKIVALVPIPTQCSAGSVGRAVEREIRQNADAFWREGNTMIELPSLGLPGRAGPGRGGSRDEEREGSDESGSKGLDPMDTIEGTIGDVLATGKRRGKGVSGETCFDGSNFDVGTLMSHNNDSSPVAKGGIETTDDGKALITTNNADGSVTETLWAADGTKLYSSTSRATTGAGGATTKTTVTTDYTSKETTTEIQTKKGNKTTTSSITSGPKGISITHSESEGSEEAGSGVSVTESWDKNGKHKGGKIVVTTNGKETSGTIAPDKSKDQKKTSGGNKSDSGGGVKLTPEGSVSMPPFCISDEEIATIINWNILQQSITDPSPIQDAEDKPNKAAKGNGPCGDLEAEDFDPNPAYLRPNKQGWVTDPPSRGRNGRAND